jgi:hypothetical protein
MVSAITSLPSASVFAISTVKPFIAVKISFGLYASAPIAFSANPHAKTTFFLS